MLEIAKKIISVFIIFLFVNMGFSQQINYYSDCFYGGVTGGGYNPVWTPGTGIMTLHIPPGSSIRKAFLFYTGAKWVSQPDYPTKLPLIINGDTLWIDTSYSINNEYNQTEGIPNSTITQITLVKDITQLTSIQNQTTIHITTPLQIGLPVFWEYYILVLYNNNNLPKTAVDVFINDQDCKAVTNYTFSPSSTINSSKDIGLALNTSSMCDTTKDGSFVFVNSFPLGLIGGNEPNSLSTYCVSPSGNFYYENDTLSGLTDDTADSLMNGTDVVANIQSYISGGPIHLKSVYQSNFRPKTNVINQIFLTYSTPCDTFPASVSQDATLCPSEFLQLHASGGTQYEWKATNSTDSLNPAPGLSCSNCPNPIFTGDSSRVYTVKIWNTDSCSVVRPVRVTVSPPLEKLHFSTSPAVCGISDIGSISLVGQQPNYWDTLWAVSSEKDTLNTNGTSLTNLAAGDYTVFYTNSYGCKSADTLVNVGATVIAEADFTVNPHKGTAPLSVTIKNYSKNATGFEWRVNGSSFGSSPPTQLDTSGTYNIQLIAWNGDSICADTATQIIWVYSNTMVKISQAFSPNGDGNNENFYIENLHNFPQTKVWIYNRWGSLVFYSDDYQNNWNGISENNLTLGSGQLPEGTYYYIVKLGGKLILNEEDRLKRGFVYVKR